MSKIKVLFFAADPLSVHGQADRLLLDEDVRQIKKKVRAAEFRDALDFDFWPAARTDDLLQALNQTQPQVVHFSGHGGHNGLVLASEDGASADAADAEALRQLFEAFRGDIQVVVLSACRSLPQAEAIAGVVGCAIGTREPISDDAAIIFNTSFYRAIAFGHSVRTAYDQARAALGFKFRRDRDHLVLVTRPDVDPAKLVLVSAAGVGSGMSEPAQAGVLPLVGATEEERVPRPPAPRPVRTARARRWGGGAAVAAMLSFGVFLAIKDPSGELVCRQSRSPVAALVPQGLLSSSTAPATTSSASGEKSLAEDDLASARDLYDVGNFTAALPLFERAAEAGNVEAMAFVGDMHLNGQGTARNPKQALAWLEKSKDTRDPRGMNALGAAYERGEGVRRQYRWALHWYRESAEGAYAPALINIAQMYEKGLGRPVSHGQALACYRKAVAAGSVDAMVDVARYYQRGLAGNPDPEEALRLYRAAADKGSARGMVEVGLMYQNGAGVAQDHAEARSWFEKGAAAGSAEAMNNLGVLYENGWGVRKDQAEADRWFRRAAEAGSAVAAANLKNL